MKSSQLKKCKQCKAHFSPLNSLQLVCSYQCALKFNSKKEVNKRIKDIKKVVKTKADYINTLQVIFNTYIRLRDKGRSCISCNKRLMEAFDAGHFYAVKNYSFLRFHEDNVHGQCGKCNQHLHGNLVEYSRKLKLRIGESRFSELEESRHLELSLSIEEIKGLISKYKMKIKEAQIKNPTD